MPLVEITPELRAKMLRRVYVFGPPNSFKTTSVITTGVYPMVLISCPGERGWGTIPKNVKGLRPFVWERSPTDAQTAESVRAEVHTTVEKAIAGEYGPIRSLVIDGFHQMYEVYLEIATGGAYGRGEDFEPRLYARAHKMADRFLGITLDSPIEYVTFTSWNAREPDRVGGDARASHEWPDLPGKAAKKMVGHFSVVAFARVKQTKLPDGSQASEWLLKPDTEVWGASVKMDPRLIVRLPTTVPQDFKKLYAAIGAAQQEIEREDEE